MNAKRFGKNDRIFLGTLAVILLMGCAWFFLFSGKDGTVVKVTVDGRLYGIYALEAEQTVEIKDGENVTNTLKISQRKADMIKADCPDKLCVHQKAISRERETIVCLPNKVVVEIIGGTEADLDSVT